MLTPSEVWYCTIFIFALAITLVCYLAHKNEPKGRLIQGMAGVCGGIYAHKINHNITLKFYSAYHLNLPNF